MAGTFSAAARVASAHWLPPPSARRPRKPEPNPGLAGIDRAYAAATGGNGNVASNGAVYFSLSGTTVHGNVADDNGTGPDTVSGNKIGGNLTCPGNNPRRPTAARRTRSRATPPASAPALG